MKCPLFWRLYSWFWWRSPGHYKRYLEMLRQGLRENKWSNTMKRVSDRKWIERLEKEVKL